MQPSLRLVLSYSRDIPRAARISLERLERARVATDFLNGRLAVVSVPTAVLPEVRRLAREFRLELGSLSRAA